MIFHFFLAIISCREARPHSADTQKRLESQKYFSNQEKQELLYHPIPLADNQAPESSTEEESESSEEFPSETDSNQETSIFNDDSNTLTETSEIGDLQTPTEFHESESTISEEETVFDAESEMTEGNENLNSFTSSEEESDSPKTDFLSTTTADDEITTEKISENDDEKITVSFTETFDQNDGTYSFSTLNEMSIESEVEIEDETETELLPVIPTRTPRPEDTTPGEKPDDFIYSTSESHVFNFTSSDYIDTCDTCVPIRLPDEGNSQMVIEIKQKSITIDGSYKPKVDIYFEPLIEDATFILEEPNESNYQDLLFGLKANEKTSTLKINTNNAPVNIFSDSQISSLAVLTSTAATRIGIRDITVSQGNLSLLVNSRVDSIKTENLTVFKKASIDGFKVNEKAKLMSDTINATRITYVCNKLITKQGSESIIQNAQINNELIMSKNSKITLKGYTFFASTSRVRIDASNSSISPPIIIHELDSVPDSLEVTNLGSSTTEYKVICGVHFTSCEKWTNRFNGSCVKYPNSQDSEFNDEITQESEENEYMCYVMNYKPPANTSNNSITPGGIAGTVIACVVIIAVVASIIIYNRVSKKKSGEVKNSSSLSLSSESVL
ncbi:hypothetical protein TRFO_21152 [Tritrichomonas foetus]|uniref:Uncharacterized protein n=1 Tax=Tritrichomonas foetus TaxID=1144522 RepID=A0A1J4KJE1_9EUKA|nr:hypothetical protein TRFO_21152 [Tritrichomonas foetus]|eukprot:OHT09798.1 hypothetical protein TRFO_21152 [Tritrichomonas foetus]